MLLRNAHWILLVVCLLLVYVFYSASDEPPSGVPGGAAGGNKIGLVSDDHGTENAKENSGGGGGIFAKLQAFQPNFLPSLSKLSDNVHEAERIGSDSKSKRIAKKPISPLIMGMNHTRLKTIL